MSRKKVNYEMQTLAKILKTGISKDKDILNLQIENLENIENLTIRDLKNIIKMKKCVKENGLMSYLSQINKEGKNNVQQE